MRLICLACRSVCEPRDVRQYAEKITWGGVAYQGDVLDQCASCEAIDELRDFTMDEALIEVEALTAAVKELAGTNHPKLRAILKRIENVQRFLETCP